MVVALSTIAGLATGAVDLVGMEPKQMSMGLARKSAMLAGKMIPREDAIKSHEELPIAPTWCANCQRLRSEQSTGGSTLVVYLLGGGDQELRTQKLC